MGSSRTSKKFDLFKKRKKWTAFVLKMLKGQVKYTFFPWDSLYQIPSDRFDLSSFHITIVLWGLIFSLSLISFFYLSVLCNYDLPNCRFYVLNVINYCRKTFLCLRTNGMKSGLQMISWHYLNWYQLHMKISNIILNFNIWQESHAMTRRIWCVSI